MPRYNDKTLSVLLCTDLAHDQVSCVTQSPRFSSLYLNSATVSTTRHAAALQQATLFWDLAKESDVGFVRVTGTALALSVYEEVCAWSRSLAAVMYDLDAVQLQQMRDKMAAQHAELQKVPEDLEQLKGVLGVVNAIR